MLTNGAESTPILQGLKMDLNDEGKWIELVKCQTTKDAQLEVLWRSVATVPHSLPLWTQLLQLTVAQNDPVNTLKVLHLVISKFPNNVDFWILAMQLSPSVETFTAALDKIEPAIVWPEFLHFLVQSPDLDLNLRVEFFNSAVDCGACRATDILPLVSHQPELYARLLVALKPHNWDLWKPLVDGTITINNHNNKNSNSSTNWVGFGSLKSHEVLEVGLLTFGPEHETELVVGFAKQSLDFKEARLILVHFLDKASSIETFCAVFSATIDLYEAEIDKNTSSTHYQVLLTELRNIVRKRPQQLSNIAIKQDPNNVQFWLERAELYRHKPHVSAHVIEQAIDSIEVYYAHNGDLADIYTQYANLLLDNGSDIEMACAPINKCLQLNCLSDRERAKLYTELAHIQNSRDSGAAIKTLEAALKGDKIEPIKPYLWMEYFKLLNGSDEILAAFSRCCVFREITPRIVISVAGLLKEDIYNQRAVYEKGVSAFPIPLSLPIWKSYLESITFPAIEEGNKQMLADVRIIYERAFLVFADHINAYEQLISLYGTLELEAPRGSILNLRRAIQRIIDRTKSKNVWDLYVATFTNTDEKRVAYERAIDHLDDIDASGVALEMAHFEEKMQELQRCQELYRYAASLHKSADILNAWQQFERRNEIGVVGFVPHY